VVIAIAAFAAIFAFADAHKLWLTLTDADPWWLVGAALCGVGAYSAMSLSYYGIAVAAGAPIPFLDMLRITLVANTVNYLVSTGGLSGFAVRMYFFTRRGLSSGTAVLISFVQTFLTNIALMFFLLGGFLYLLRAHRLVGADFLITVALLGLLGAGAVVAGLLLFHPKLRRRTLFWLGQAGHWVMYRLLPHRTPPRFRVWRLQRNIDRGVEFLLTRKRQMIGPVLYILLDWTFTLLILDAAFLVVNHPIRFSVLIIGFAVAIVFSFVSLIPGGLGVMEGSMAAVFAGFGVPFETAIVAALVFRFVYYVLPILVSLFFFHAAFVQGRQASEELKDEDLPPMP